MDSTLNEIEIRVLGSLMEKEMATPDYYPLSLNALINACNQKSNRNPVVQYDEDTALGAVNLLKEKRYVRQSNVGRVEKYEQIFSDGLNLTAREKAVLCVLLLRGAQTIGEIRGRTERLYGFEDLDEVKSTVTNLEESGLTRKLPRQPGRKESRYMQLLGGETSDEYLEPTQVEPVPQQQHDDRVAALEQQVAELQEEFNSLRQEFTSFKSQFE